MPDIIMNRTSVRSWTEQMVEPEKIDAILRAAMQAPSAMNSQPWEFVVIENKELIEKLAMLSPYSHFAAKAPVMIGLLCRKENSCPPYNQIDMGICIENVLLEVVAQGLGAVCLGIAPLADRMEAMSKVLGIDDSLESFALIPLGYPARKQKPADRYDDSRVHWIR